MGKRKNSSIISRDDREKKDLIELVMLTNPPGTVNAIRIANAPMTMG